ncbi:hypothetical protein Q5752_005237 [Cryptotrichosporon argae]
MPPPVSPSLALFIASATSSALSGLSTPPASTSRLPLLAAPLPAALRPDPRPGQCRLLGPAALVVQALMGLGVLASLVAKRQMEKKKRRWRVWTWDVAKQLAGQAVVHGLNLLISDLVAHAADNNPCSLYFLNVALDTTVGVAVFYLALRAYTAALTRCGFDGLASGMYGDPPRPSYWWRQLAPYLLAIVTMKLAVLLPLTLPRISAALIGGTQALLARLPPNAQVVVVLAVFPLIMNVFQFCVIDQIVKAGTGAKGVDGADNDAGDAPGDERGRTGSGYERVPTRDIDHDHAYAHAGRGDLRRRNSSARDLTQSPQSASMPASPLMHAQDGRKPDHYGATSPRPAQEVRLRRPSRNSLRDDARASTGPALGLGAPTGTGSKSPASSVTLALDADADDKLDNRPSDHRPGVPSPDTAASVAPSTDLSRLGDAARDARRELSPPRSRHVERGLGLLPRG